MLPNGQALVIDMAVRALDDPFLARYRSGLVLGALREDVAFVPGTRLVFPRLSFTHFYEPGLPGGLVPFLTTGPRRRTNALMSRARAAYARGRAGAAIIALGRAAHLLIDMACPVHSHRTVHMIDDPYEWYVEGNVAALRALPVPSWPDRARPSELVDDLARYAQPFTPDGTHSPWGAVLRRVGVRQALTAAVIAEQARALIPAAAAATAALLRLFLREAKGR
jgi:hypothetical protein